LFPFCSQIFFRSSDVRGNREPVAVPGHIKIATHVFKRARWLLASGGFGAHGELSRGGCFA
jgi:hypothetical protein